jgi:LEA14-like dessication related protein
MPLRHTVFLLLFLALPGCESVNSLLAGMDKPSASISGVKLQNLNLEGVTLLFDVDVANPYTVPLPLVNVAYGLSSRGSKFLEGTADVQGSVPAKGKKTIQLPAAVTFASLLKTVQGVKLGSVVPYSAELGLSVDAPAVGRLSLPIKKEGELPIPAVPSVELASVQWKSLNLNSAEAVLKLNVTNNNEFAVDMSRLAYSLALSDTPIIETSLAKGAKFEKGATHTLEIPISLKPSNLGLAAFNMLTGKGASYSLGGTMGVGTAFGPLDLPFKREGKTTFLH